MKMTINNTIAAGEFKTHCLKLIDEVYKTLQPIVITKRGKPLATLSPAPEHTPAPLYGCMGESVIIHEDIVSSTGESWAADNE